MKVLVTGAAGFIGMHTALRLLARGDDVIGIDNLNDYYDVQLKRDRLQQLEPHAGFRFIRMDLADRPGMDKLFAEHRFNRVINLAAQPGVRYSLKNPWAYASANYVGTLNVFEAAHASGIKTVIYASSSSVYGDNAKTPFAEDDRTDTPISTYAASKKANELLAYSYHHLFGMNMIGIRFFTVYGDFYRLDMALFKFAKSIMLDREIQLHNGGDMKREFTHVDDIVAGVIAMVDREVVGYRIYNLGGSETISVKHFLALIEAGLGRKARVHNVPIQAGELKETIADISRARQELGFDPQVRIDDGIKRFCDWFLANQSWLLPLKDAEN